MILEVPDLKYLELVAMFVKHCSADRLSNGSNFSTNALKDNDIPEEMHQIYIFW